MPEAFAVRVEVQQPFAEVRGTREQPRVLCDRQARRRLLELVPEALDVGRLRENAVGVCEQPLRRHLGTMRLCDAFDESTGDVGLGGLRIAVEEDDMLPAERTSEVVQIGDRV